MLKNKLKFLNSFNEGKHQQLIYAVWDWFKKTVNKPVVFFFLILFLGFFLIFPPSLNFGDQSSWGLVYYRNLAGYLTEENKTGGSFAGYLKNRYREVHHDKLEQEDLYDTYGLDKNVRLSIWTDPLYFSGLPLEGLSRIGLYFLFGGLLSVDVVLQLLGLIIFVLTYIYAYKLGSLLKDEWFGLILAVIGVSNVYFNQVIRSMLFPFLSFYPLLFFGAFYYLLLLHKKAKKKKRGSIIGLAMFLAASFLNAYPNSNILLLFLVLASFFILIFQIKIFKEKSYKLTSLKNYFLVFFAAIFLVIAGSGFWSILIGEKPFYVLGSIFQVRVWGMFFQRKVGLTEIVRYPQINEVPLFVRRFLRTLLIATDHRNFPHEASFLNDIRYFNILEFLGFAVAPFFLVKNIFSKRVIDKLILFFLLFALYRFFTNPGNHLLVARYSYDIYFMLIFPAAYGLYYLFIGIEKIFGQKRFLLLGVILILAGLNISTFNRKFVFLFGETLNQSYGLHIIRILYRKEILKGNNLIVHHYQNFPLGYQTHFDLFTLLRGEVDYEVFYKFFEKEKIKSKRDFENYIRNSPYKNVYFIFPSTYYRVGESILFEPKDKLPPILDVKGQFLADYPLYKIIKNRRGFITYWVYRFNKSSFK